MVSRAHNWVWGGWAVLLASIGAAIYFSGWVGVDWPTFRESALLLSRGQSPYDNPNFYNPPWILLPLLPLAWLPERLGYTLAVLSGVCCYAWVSRRSGGRGISLILFVFSPAVLFDLYAGNISWLVLAGMFLPAPVGLFFALAKPHMGICLAIFWLVQAWREAGPMQALKTFTPVGLALAASILWFGPWPLRMFRVIDQPWNTSLWPYGLPAGVALFLLSLHRREARLALASSPFFSPYLVAHGWTAALVGLAPSVLGLLLANLLLLGAYFIPLWIHSP